MTGTKALLVAVTCCLGVACLAAEAAAAQRINACTTITQSGPYALTRNLTATGDCIIVATDFVTIDLAGFTLTGNGTGTGIRASGLVNQKGIVVRDGMVVNFNRGVDLSNILDAVIERVYAVDNVEVGIFGGDFSTLNRNVARGGVNGVIGLHGSIVTGNIIAGASANGLVVDGGGLATGNNARGNGGAGIFVTCPTNVIGNTATLNSGGNLVLNPATPTGCNLSDNVAP